MKTHTSIWHNVCQYIGILIIFVTFLAYHLTMDLGWGDDTFYLDTFNKNGLVAFLIQRYQNWSSRLLIDGVIGIIVHFPLVWKVCNIFISLIIYKLMTIILKASPKEEIFCAITIILYPFTDMNSAGWIATCINYWWVLATALITIYYTNKYFTDTVSIFEKIILIISFLFSVNHEQVAVLIFIYLLWLPLKYLSQPHIVVWKNKVWVTLIICSIAGIIFAATSPGNHVRMLANTEYWMPTFTNFSLIDKVYIAFYRIFVIFIAEPNLISLLFCILVFVSIYETTKNWLWRIIAFLPLTIQGIYFFRPLIHDRLSKLDRIYALFVVPPQIQTIDWYDFNTWFIMLLLLVFIGSLILLIVQIYDSPITAINRVLFPLGIGIISCVILGFSPTIWASADRTAIFMYFILIYCINVLWSQIKNKFIKNGIIILTIPFVLHIIYSTIINI